MLQYLRRTHKYCTAIQPPSTPMAPSMRVASFAASMTSFASSRAMAMCSAAVFSCTFDVAVHMCFRGRSVTHVYILVFI